jgi:hypothetical protein
VPLCKPSHYSLSRRFFAQKTKSWFTDVGDVTFHEEPKLRTVLWGWAGQQIPTHLQTDLHRTMQAIRESELTNLLTEHELSATLDRITELTTSAVFAEPNDEWPSLPWPLF